MVAINFQKRFAKLITDGKKSQTCRRKARCHPGSKLQIYTGQRTKKAKKIMDAICTEVLPVRFDRDFLSINNQRPVEPNVMDEFSKLDGFKDWDDMIAFFDKMYYKTDFVGYLIRWRPHLRVVK